MLLSILIYGVFTHLKRASLMYGYVLSIFCPLAIVVAANMYGSTIVNADSTSIRFVWFCRPLSYIVITIIKAIFFVHNTVLEVTIRAFRFITISKNRFPVKEVLVDTIYTTDSFVDSHCDLIPCLLSIASLKQLNHFGVNFGNFSLFFVSPVWHFTG